MPMFFCSIRYGKFLPVYFNKSRIGLSITCELDKKVVDFLDVRFNLNEQTYEPYRKPNNEPVYINIQSNHPPNIISVVPKAISNRLTNIS